MHYDNRPVYIPPPLPVPWRNYVGSAVLMVVLVVLGVFVFHVAAALLEPGGMALVVPAR